MYAVIRVKGKQYRVERGDSLDVDLLDSEQGASLEFDDVLFVSDGDTVHVGAPKVEGYAVKVEVMGPTVGPKITSVKHRKRQNSKRKWGHRQHYTRVKVLDILGGSAPKKTSTKAKKESKEQAE